MKYQVMVEDRTFEIEIGPGGRIWVNHRPLDVDLEGVDELPQYSLLMGHRSFDTLVEDVGEGAYQVQVAGRAYRASLVTASCPNVPPCRRKAGRTGPVEVCAPLPGMLIELCVVEGDRVEEGDVVAVLESMKMHLELDAPCTGVVQTVREGGGREVAQGEVLAVIVP